MMAQDMALPFVSRLFRRLAIPLSLGFLLSACMTEDYSARYALKSDAKPHQGVATAMRYPVHGIDISRWQGDIDWRAVRSAGTRFAFIKATEGGDHIDPRFVQNWNGARAAGIPTGAYHFVYWCRPAHEQAHWFVQHIPQANDDLALPPILDVEWNGHSRTCPKKVSREVAIEKMKLMLRELEQHTGKRPIIYTDIPFHKDVIEGTTEFEGYPFWIRSTAARPEERYANRRWEFWQFTTTGRVPGIRGDVDRNAFYGSEEEFEAWVAGKYDIAQRRPTTRFARAPQGAAEPRATALAPAETDLPRAPAPRGGQDPRTAAASEPPAE
ncbi:MAG: glycoside hydrolase family 25 protein [Methylocystis sp.]|nr:glycoside hydrolase family 25 protein [Methylocystis sp.]